MTRIEEWKEAYVDALMRCDFGSSIESELERILAEGVRGKNRWVYYHHLRILAAKADGFSHPAAVGADLRARIEAALTRKPDVDGFDAAGTARELTEGVAAFVRRLRQEYQDPLFTALEEATSAFRGERFFEAFRRTRELRGKVVGMIDRGGFDEHRYHLCQLEGLLEEMGYLALGHVATRYQEQHVDIPECLAVIRLSALNLRYDGLESRDLTDLAAILDDPAKTDAELLDVLHGIERVHHRIRQRVTIPYEKLMDRLALQPNDLRLILANMQRYLHDLNSMAHFTDLAATALREGVARGTPYRPAASEGTPGEMDHLILHLSHRPEIARWISDDGTGASLRDRYGAKGSGLLYISYLNLPDAGRLRPPHQLRPDRDASARARSPARRDRPAPGDPGAGRHRAGRRIRSALAIATIRSSWRSGAGPPCPCPAFSRPSSSWA